MTEIMPVPRNSHITVLRPPIISAALFRGGGRPSSTLSNQRRGAQYERRLPAQGGCAGDAMCEERGLPFLSTYYNIKSDIRECLVCNGGHAKASLGSDKEGSAEDEYSEI